jgi:hypothetical protein
LLRSSFIAQGHSRIETRRSSRWQPARYGGNHEKTTAIVAYVAGSVAFTPTSIVVIPRVRNSAAINPPAMPVLTGEAESLPNNKAEDSAGSSAQGHANADLSGALTHNSRKHTIKPDAGK